MEVVGLLSAFAAFGWPVVDLRQGFIAFGIGVDIGIFAVPNEAGFIFEIVWKAETAYVPHAPYVGIEGFVWASAC